MASLPSYSELQEMGVLSSEARALQYCLDVGLLRPQQFCEQCNNYMGLQSCAASIYNDGYCWTCPAPSSHRRSVRSGSILHKRTISFSTFIHLIWLFCNYMSVTDATRILSINYKTVRTTFESIRRCMANDLLNDRGTTTRIGGPGHIIEVDECKFGKRKYNRGRRVVGKWILGGYSRTSNECFLVECPYDRRDHHTLLRLIKDRVLPGTTILTDCWRAYSALSQHGYTHLTVNHQRGFVNPATGVHTNTCEGMWFHAKNHMNKGTGRSRTDYTAMYLALSEFMWRKRYGLTKTDESVEKAFKQDIPNLFKRTFD